MLYKNFGHQLVLNASVDNFTTDTGIRIRRRLNPLIRKALHLICKQKIICEKYPVLKKDVPYIFCPTHLFAEDIISSIATLDRQAYLLMGTTEQIIRNPQSYAAWVNGMIYVDRQNPKSRADSCRKMERILNAGSSVLLFPEGGWNNTENLLVQPLFAGPYKLARATGRQVVPLSAFRSPDRKTIYTRVGNPISIAQLDKITALDTLRDAMATLMFENMFLHGERVSRAELSAGTDCRMNYMSDRRAEYLTVSWRQDVWEEELAFYKDRRLVYAEDLRAHLEKIHIDEENAGILAPVLARWEEDKKYDFKQFMHRTWNVEQDRSAGRAV